MLWRAAAKAQFPDKFKNLKVLPKDISKAELQSTMRGFAFALNVRCDHCHVEKPGGGKVAMDFAADDKEAKKTARLTIEMVATSLLAQKKYKEAMANMEMSFDSNHPDSVWSYHLLAMAHQANGQIDQAIADYRKALELHPRRYLGQRPNRVPDEQVSILAATFNLSTRITTTPL